MYSTDTSSQLEPRLALSKDFGRRSSPVHMQYRPTQLSTKCLLFSPSVSRRSTFPLRASLGVTERTRPPSSELAPPLDQQIATPPTVTWTLNQCYSRWKYSCCSLQVTSACAHWWVCMLAMADTNLISKLLHPGDRIRIGRNRACELVIPCPNLSGLHCVVEVRNTSESPRPSPFDGSDPTKCTVLDLSSNGTWLLKGEEDVARPKKLKKGVTVDFCPGDCLMLLAPQHELCMQHRFVLRCNSATKGEAGCAEFVLVQLPWEGGDSSTAAAEELLRGKPCGSGKVDSKSDDLGNHTTIASTKGIPSARKRKSSCDPVGGELNTNRDSLNLKKSRLEATSSLGDHASINAKEVEVATGVKRKLRTADDNYTPCEESTSHREEENDHDTPDGMTKVESIVSGAPALLTTLSLERCPSCLKLFPVLELMAHAEVCMHDSSRRSDEAGVDMGVLIDIAVSKPAKCETESVVSKPVAASTHSISAPPSMPTVEVSMERCPSCLKLFPLYELVEHCEVCRPRKTTVREEEVKALEPIDADNSSRCNLESYSDFTATRVSGNGTSLTVGKEGKKKPSYVPPQVGEAACGTSGELEQCLYCLKDFPVPELVCHVKCCPARDRSKSMIEEHCQHCLKVFPLDELVTHALNCSQRKNLGSLESEMGGGVLGSQDVWGEPMERCMFCFKDFPLSMLVEHSRKCTGDMLGSLKRFENFLPSVHDLDAMVLTVLTDTQMSAMEYVLRKSKEDSERVYPKLLKKVLRLGYTENDLERTLQWVRQDAPIIIHVNLNRTLRFLVEDTHYRNIFEIGAGFSARRSWEDRIFNRVYKHSPPMERVKYGVLNIVGDPRGVRCCYGYGDSFLQLKKVRLRTTFASADTSYGTVKLSCCEHYGNVLNEYSDPELRAILDVATRKKTYLRSDMISQYKEIQIHGPVCLSENVDCIVVNDRHMHDASMKKLLDKFVEKNKCNLIWMEPESTISYPGSSGLTP